MSSIARYLTLNTGAKMPVIGLGTYLALGGNLAEVVDRALYSGYRHIDGAYSYSNEHEIGQALKDNFKSNRIKRKELFITTKISNYRLHKQDVGPTLEESLEKLNLTYVDMLLLHSPWSITGDPSKGERHIVDYDIIDSWKALEAVFKQGKTKAIGVSNYTQRQIERITRASTVPPANLQLECHAYLQQNELRRYCENNGIVVSAYSPIGSPGRPADRKTDEEPSLLDDPTIEDISKTLRQTKAQILLRFLMQNNMVVLTKTENHKRIVENYESFDFELPEDCMERIRGLNRNYKYFRFPWARNHPEYFENEAF